MFGSSASAPALGAERVLVRFAGDGSPRAGTPRDAGSRALAKRYHAELSRVFVAPARPPAIAALRRRAPSGPALAAARDALERTWSLEVATPELAAEAAREWAALPGVEYAEVDRRVRAAYLPDDPFLYMSGSVGSWGQPFADLWGLQRAGAEAAWDVAAGEGVVVAIVDSGIDYAHPDLAANVWVNGGEVAGNAVDDDGNGYADDVVGYDFANEDSDPVDEYHHGTHVAGIVAAAAGNGIGIAGLAHGARVMGLGVLGASGVGRVSDAARAVVYAVDNGARVVNLSIAAHGRSMLMADAVGYAHAAGVVCVAAAGNDGAETADTAPANEPAVLTVSAFDAGDRVAAFSNRGVKMDLAAAGGGDPAPPSVRADASVLSLLAASADPSRYDTRLVVGDAYLRLAGTSMAAPFVSAAAALVLSLHPDWDVERVRQALRATARDVSRAGFDIESGYGFVDAAAAVLASEPLVAHVETPLGGPFVAGGLVDIVGSALGSGFESYDVEVGSGFEPTSWTTIADDVATPVDRGVLTTWDTAALLDGSYVVRLRARRGAEVFEDRVGLVVGSASIDTPEVGAALRGGAVVEIRGTAAGAGFASYHVDVRRPAAEDDGWTSDGIVRASPGAPVIGGLLATFDTASVGAGDRFDFRLRVANANGTVTVERLGVVIDPSIKPGWPRQLAPVADHQYLTVADLDDAAGKQILVGSGNDVVVYEADGSTRAGWPRSVAGAFPDSTTTGSPIAADIDGDGNPEVVATNRFELFAWEADGTPVAGFPATGPALGGGGVHLAAADLDGDGDGDDEIVVSGASGSQAFHGDGSDVEGWNWTDQLGDAPLTLADVSGDSRSEAAFYNRVAKTAVVGRRTLSLRGPLREALSRWPRRARASGAHVRPSMADVDGDGALDLLLLDEKKASRLRLSAYDAGARRLRVARWSLRGACREIAAVCRPDSSGALSFADLDRDGAAEAVLFVRTPVAGAGNEYGHFVIVGPAGARSTPARRSVAAPATLVSTAIADLDGDGIEDIVGGAVGFDARRLVRMGLVAATAAGAPIAGFPKPLPTVVNVDPGEVFPSDEFEHFDDARFATPAVVDLDGDGRREVAFVDPVSYRLFVWDGAGSASAAEDSWPMYARDPGHSNALVP